MERIRRGQVRDAVGVRAGERTCDRERVPRVLDVDEQRPAVRRKAGTGELARCTVLAGADQPVAGKGVGTPVRGDAHHALDSVAVLGDQHVAPGRNHEVVGRVELLAPLGFEMELEPVDPAATGVARRRQAEDLPLAGLAARSVVEPEGSAGEMAAFQPLEPRRALGDRIFVRIIRVDVDPYDAQAFARVTEIDVELGPALDRHRLQLAAVLQGPRLLRAVVRQIPVEEARTSSPGDLLIGGDLFPAEVVLGQVDDAGPRVDVDRLVREETHPADRCPRELALRIARVDFERVSVARRASLLTRHPGAPGGAASRTVVQRAGRRHERPHGAAGAIYHQRCRTARRVLGVRVLLGHRVLSRVTGGQLMVSHENGGAAGSGHGHHPVEVRGHGRPVRERVLDRLHDAVAEATRQIKDPLGVLDEATDARPFPVTGQRRSPWAQGHRRAARRGCAHAQESLRVCISPSGSRCETASTTSCRGVLTPPYQLVTKWLSSAPAQAESADGIAGFRTARAGGTSAGRCRTGCGPCRPRPPCTGLRRSAEVPATSLWLSRCAPAQAGGAGLLACAVVAVQGSALDRFVDQLNQLTLFSVGECFVAALDRVFEAAEVGLDRGGVAPVFEALTLGAQDALPLGVNVCHREVATTLSRSGRVL